MERWLVIDQRKDVYKMNLGHLVTEGKKDPIRGHRSSQISIEKAPSAKGAGKSMDRGAWRATVHRVAKGQTQLRQLSEHARILNTIGSNT